MGSGFSKKGATYIAKVQPAAQQRPQAVEEKTVVVTAKPEVDQGDLEPPRDQLEEVPGAQGTRPRHSVHSVNSTGSTRSKRSEEIEAAAWASRFSINDDDFRIDQARLPTAAAAAAGKYTVRDARKGSKESTRSTYSSVSAISSRSTSGMGPIGSQRPSRNQTYGCGSSEGQPFNRNKAYGASR
eukprot:TRINITY_DN93859_c0_g1_i1.p1 TRINITY_DN93859_c0_g1~~TRINITY_DN93859_c0_g1_i1.p1  ORF type:complete len:184 (+),score=31.64 TRINITY_DN93859_c0_g1_i1:80-631(+)